MVGCTQCGECCKKYGWRLEATPLDIVRWRAEKRHDILLHVGIQEEDGDVIGGALWVNTDGSHISSCPFLEHRSDGKYYCGIQETKPEVCTTHWCIKYVEPSD